MGASPAKFLFGFLFVSVILWLIFTFASRLLAWFLSRVLGASVQFRVGGWKCLKDINVKFKKGAVESVSVGEIRLSLRQSLVKLGVGIFSRDPKLQVLISDLEVVIRTSSKSASSSKSAAKKKSRKSRASGRGKWMVVANMARFLSVSVTELAVKTPKAAVEMKELRLEISKDGGSHPALFVKLHLVPLSVYLGESRLAFDQSAVHGELMEKTLAPFNCEDLSLLCEIGHNRDTGIVVRNVDVTSGEVSVLLTEELLVKKKSSSDTNTQAVQVLNEANEANTIKKLEKKSPLLAIPKFMTMFPEKIGFTLPKLDVKFLHRGHDLAIDNNIMGIQLKSIKSRSVDYLSESTRLDVQLDFSEIHLFRDAGISMVEILKLDVISLVYIPLQPSAPIRSEIDIRLGGTQCNLLVSRLVPWVQLHSSKPKKMVLREESSMPEKPRSTEQNAVMWTCTMSAPEMTIVLYNLSDLPLYHACSQSSHIFANNISSTGTAVHMELGELNLHLSDEYHESLKESLFGVEVNAGSLLHIAKVGLDWGKKDMDSPEDGRNCKMVLSSDVTGMGVYLTFRRLESLVSTAFSFQSLLKKSSGSSKKPAHVKGVKSFKSSGKGIQLVKFNLERCSLNFRGEVGLENAVVEDPKRVNYGSQGGRFVISVSSDGTPRTADVMSTISDEVNNLKYSVSLDIFHLGFSLNKEKQSAQMELERARSIYQEFLEESIPRTNIVLLDMQNAKFVRRSGGLKEIAVCSLFSATDISVRWEPDPHIALAELGLQLKLLVHNHKRQVQESKDNVSNLNIDEKKEIPVDALQSEKPKKKESIFAIDVEMLRISAEAGDGVETTVQVQSIFSENARIGVLLEGLILDFNEARVFKSSRMQVSRVPNTSSNASNGNMETCTAWDWVIQALDVHVCMPYRLQLRAIDDSVEEMLRALKLITAAKAKMLFPVKKEGPKTKKASSAKIGRVRFCIRKLTADIEEEPLQGWLDEHYQLLKNEACELAVRLKFLDDLSLKAGQSAGANDKNDSVHESKILCEGEEIDVQDPESIQKLRDKVYKQSFRSYYQACQKLVPSPGSGACKEGFQAGFKFSTTRSSVLAIVATELDLSLTRIDGGDAGMIEVLQKLDPVCRAHNIPFSRLYGSNILLQTGSLVAQLRNYTCPLFAGTSGRCEGRLVLAQQATCFQPQIRQNVFVGRWRKVCMLRSASGTTPPVKTYCDLPIHFQKAEISFGVGFEPVFADVSYAFTVALRRANLSLRNPNPDVQPPKKEKSLPWWDEMRNYIHGHTTLYLSETKWNVLATTDPYENSDKLQIFSGYMEIQQSDGRVYITAKNFKILVSSLENLLKNSSLKPISFSGPFLEAPTFSIEVIMEWDCESGNPLNHYLFALPVEGVPREKVYDPFRSTNLSLRWNLSLRPSVPSSDNGSETSATKGDHLLLDGASYGPFASTNASTDSPTVNLGPHDLAWLIKFWNLNYLPPHKLRMFSRWPRFGVPRIPRSGNLSMDKVMTEFMFRVDAAPTCIRHMPLDDDDPAKGLNFKMNKLKYELCFSRGKQKYTFDSKRDTLDLVYQGLDLHMPKVYINKEECLSVSKAVELSRKSSQSASVDRLANDKSSVLSGITERHRDDGFLLSSDYFTIRRQAPKADPVRLLTWQESGRRNLELTYVRSEFENGSESDEHTRSDPSDDDGYNVVIADNCQRVFVYGLKLLWTLENRDAVWSWVGGISKAFESPKPSPSRLYAQRKLLEENQAPDKSEINEDDKSKSASVSPVGSSSPQNMESSKSQSPPSNNFPVENSLSGAIVKPPSEDSEGEGTRHFMVNVIEPQFNLHSEEANGRFLLAALSGRVLARSFHSVLQIGLDMIEQALGGGNVQIPESQPELTWNRMEFSVMLENVQAHVAPTDVDPGAGLQWLPKIRRSSPKVKRTGALLERVFMPCNMYFQYTRHKGGTTDLKVKPLKELIFNSQNITATMTSRQFQIMLDVLTNLLFARLPKPRKSSLSYPTEDDDIEEEADEVVPDGVEEVELARIELEQKDRMQKIILDDIRKLSLLNDASGDANIGKEDELWMIVGGRTILVQRLKRELVNAQKSRKAASASLRMALQKAAQLRLMEKEKNKSPSCAMRISLQITKVVWSMLVDGKSFAEAEINDMIYDFDRDYKDVGVARFTTKYFVVRNCLPNAKSDMLLSAWNPPPEWGKKVMLRVDAKQGAPKEGNSPLELFQVEIYPLKIHLTETMYRMMWEYFFPEEEQDSQRRQEVWKVSTTAGSRRVKKGLSSHDALAPNSSTKDSDVVTKSSTSTLPVSSATNLSVNVDPSQPSKLQNLKANIMCGSTPELRRTSSFDKTWEESLAESVANELVLQAHSPSISSLKTGSFANDEISDEQHKNKNRDAKTVKPGRSSHEEKKVGKAPEDKRSRPRRLREFNNIKISQVELLVTYEGSRFAVSDLRLLMDTFHRVEFTGTWRRLFSRVKKHIIWGVLKSVTGMQGKKFKDKAPSQKEVTAASVPDIDLNFSDSDGGSAGKSNPYPLSWPKRPSDGAGDGFVTSIRGLFNSQRRKAKAFVLRTMRGEADNESHADWSESEAEFSPFARQLTITKAKRLIRRHTKKFRSRGQKGATSQQRDSLPSSPREMTTFDTDSSSESSPYEDSNE
ncbi:OLC1v1017206C1 [Oldenlandia corymbosa var. corymbosa]|uniref:OLC1v1017206C1 n=1 Tax=Oldenlandia corymbosa var. corymbosa TaxID=529605 RepID=A0AAV1E8Y0_OLDCO|nr:OLC1v1017206C1 [Oldenlandia corymbosa var. corymbosa]